MIIVKEAVSQKTEKDRKELYETVSNIISRVKKEGDVGVKELTLKFDGVSLKNIEVDRKDLKKAYNSVSSKTVESIEFAAEQIRIFATNQLSCLKPLEYENIPGVTLGHKLIPVSSCGAYVPAGLYPLPSSALMSIIPAKVAGVKHIAVCSPPFKKFSGIHPAVLVAMDIAGVDEVYCMGGAQAIAAYAYGTDTVQPVDIIVGPGNQYVTEAKRQLSGMVGIDMLAGPSEVLIIADDSASPRYIAVDLLAKCEHDPNSVAILVTTSSDLAEKVQQKIGEELKTLETAELASATWEKNGQIILVEDIDEAAAISDDISAEHLQLQTCFNDELIQKLNNFGSLFIGDNAPVSFGDYVSGTNHILPTEKCARYTNGVWVGTFMKVLSYQKISREGAAKLIGPCSHLANVEGLFMHKRSAEIRKS